MMSDLEKTNGIYMGHLYQRDTNNGKKQYKVMFKPFADSDKQFSFRCFDSTNGFNELVEGEEYGVGYVTNEPYTNKAGIVVSNSKTAMFFGTPFDLSSNPNNTGQALPNSSDNPSEVTHTTQTSPGVVGFIKTYKATVSATGTEPDMAHALGTYLIENMGNKSTVTQFKSAWENN